MAKSDNVAVATTLLDDFTSIKVKELIELRPWMKSKRFILLTKQTEIEDYIDKCIQKGLCVYDLETNSLNTRTDANGGCHAKIVGICLSHDPDEGIYIPVAHEHAEEFNVSLSFMIRQTKKLAANCVLIFHNFKYDGQILRANGVIIDNEDMYEDTYLMAAIEDASRKTKGLKYLSGALLDRPQLEIDDLGIQGTKKNVVAFYLVPPQKAVYYGGGDGMNTLALYLYLKGKLDAIDPTGKGGPWAIYKVEKRCLFVTMEMERNLVKIDKQYLIKINAEVELKMSELIRNIFSIVGHEFDINSTQQLGSILFDQLKLSYPPKAEKTKTGHYQTNSEILEMISTKNPIINLILIYRGYVKIQSTYLYNWLINADENDEVKFQLNQVQADTGRFSGSGGQGLDIDGYCGVNCQNIPTYDKSNPHAVNLRRAMIAHFGYKMVSIDYSGEELRIATNFSKEPKWVQEFLHGTGDLHTITGRIITGKTEITKKERSLGKTINFLTMYGGGAGGFAAQAKIPFETAKKMIISFFREYVGLNSWIKREWAASRKRGYSKTAFGRRRPLEEFYNSPDKGIQSKGDRCAINSAIQGTGADVIKIALWRVYKWIYDNNLQDDVKILLPVHDEILFEVREEKMDMIIPELCRLMKIRDVTDKLKWVVPLEVDAEYGDSFHVDHNYWEEMEARMKDMSSPVSPMETPALSPENLPEAPEMPDKPEPSTALIGKEEEKKSKLELAGSVTVTESTTNEAPSYYQNLAAVGVETGREVHRILDRVVEKVDTAFFKDTNIEKDIDKEGFFNYTIDADLVSAQKLKFILETVRLGNNRFIGPRKKLCLMSKDGEVFYRSLEEFSIDSFLVLCIMLGV
jgi:DNA polymerase-1